MVTKESSSNLKKALVIDNNLCTGCRNCELACSVRHTNTFNPARARIQILKDEFRATVIPMVCLQCDSPLCAEACPTGAISENSVGVLTVNHDLCIGCSNCVTACIYGGIVIDPLLGKAIKCDLCGGEPACIDACTYRAISLQSTDSQGLRGRSDSVRSLRTAYGLSEVDA